MRSDYTAVSMGYGKGTSTNRKMFVIKLLVVAFFLVLILQYVHTSVLLFMGFDIGLFVIVLSLAVILYSFKGYLIGSWTRQAAPHPQNPTTPAPRFNAAYTPAPRHSPFLSAKGQSATEISTGKERAGKRILVTYASVTGSTPEIAQELGNELRKAGYIVEVVDMRTVTSLENYTAIVIGVPVYTGPLGLGEIGNFTKKRFSGQLAKIPVALFAVGLVYAGIKPDTEYIMTNLKAALAPLTPVSLVLFTGTLDPNKLSLYMHFANIRQIPSGDFQDWDTIRAWARELPALLDCVKI